MQESFSFKLQSPIQIHAKENGLNAVADCEEIELFSPSERDNPIVLRLEQGFTRALLSTPRPKNVSVEETGKENAEIDARFIQLILFAGDHDIGAYFESFKSLLVKVAKVNGRAITSHEVSRIKLGDLKQLICKYLEIFFIVSWTQILKENSAS